MAEQFTLPTTIEATGSLPEVLTEADALRLLSYQDVLEGDMAADALARNREHPNAAEYARTLADMSAEVGTAKLMELATSLRDACTGTLRATGIEPSQYGESASWALWDLAKQRHMFRNPEQSGERYRPTLADPLDGGPAGASKRLEILDRHIGWELDSSLTGSPAGPHRARLTSSGHTTFEGEPGRAMRRILHSENRKPDRQLPSDELSRLGSLVREKASQLTLPKTTINAYETASHAPAPVLPKAVQRHIDAVMATSGIEPLPEHPRKRHRPANDRPITWVTETSAPVSREQFADDLDRRRPGSRAAAYDLAARRLVADVLGSAVTHPSEGAAPDRPARTHDRATPAVSPVYTDRQRQLETHDHLMQAYDDIASWRAA